MLYLVKEHLAKRKQIALIKTPAQVLLELAGSREDDRKEDQSVSGIKRARKNSKKLQDGY